MGIDSRRFDSEVVVNPWLPAQWLKWHDRIERADRAAEALGHELACVNRTKAGILMQLISIEKKGWALLGKVENCPKGYSI